MLIQSDILITVNRIKISLWMATVQVENYEEGGILLFGRFYLDKEKDLIVTLFLRDGRMDYVLSTPNHHTGNLIRNLARLCGLPLDSDEKGLMIIKGTVPCYIDAYNMPVYIFRLGGTKVANIFPDGRIEMKASIPSLSKTLMSQTKDYCLDISKTIIKSYILEECKFRTDLHTHMNANLHPDILIALGIFHQIRYPLYYIRKLGLRLNPSQEDLLRERREKASLTIPLAGLSGKYLERKIDDNTFLNFASLFLDNPADAEYNIPKIRASLAVMKDGQAVFTNLEKVYLYRYVFTKGKSSEDRRDLSGLDSIPDGDIRAAVKRMEEDHRDPRYRENSLFQDKLLWIARGYRSRGIVYVEISDTALVKKDRAAEMLAEIHTVMPAITEETGVTIRFLAGLRRIPLTIVKDNIARGNYLEENLEVLRAVAEDPYVAGSDILGEEINDIRDMMPAVRELVSITEKVPDFVIRIHAGENDSLRENVANSIQCVLDSLKEGQGMPNMRIGHGLYTSDLRKKKGKQLLKLITDHNVTLEFQISSNVRLNNLSMVERHPLREYLSAGVLCVQGTDGGALYGTDSIDEELALEKLLSLTKEELLLMRSAEERSLSQGMEAFRRKMELFSVGAVFPEGVMGMGGEGQSLYHRVLSFYRKRIREELLCIEALPGQAEKEDSATVFREFSEEIDPSLVPVIIAGGSFNNDQHRTVLQKDCLGLLDRLLALGDPSRICFVIGHELKAYEQYLVKRNQGRFRVYAFVPAEIGKAEAARLKSSGLSIRVCIEPSSIGIYKSIAYEIFKRRSSVLLALDGNSQAVNLVQEAKNAKHKCRIFVNPRSRMLHAKATMLRGYAELLDAGAEGMAEKILGFIADIS